MKEKRGQTSNLRESLMGIVGNAPFGILTLSNDLEVTIINAIALELLGFDDMKPSQMVDQPYRTIFSKVEDLAERFEKFIHHKMERHLDLTNIKFNDCVLNIRFRSMLHGTLVIIENITKQAHLERELLRHATYDDLTQLMNRKQFEKRVELLVEKGKSQDISAAVIFIDLDHVKPVNDIGGHMAGDALLKRVATILKGHAREQDIVARFGGDEFTVLLEKCTIKEAVSVAEKIRQGVEALSFSYQHHTFNITLSAGIAPITGREESVRVIMSAADRACQIAKKSGRNRIHVIDEKKGELKSHIQEIEWIAKIKDALASNDFILYGQKIEPLDEQSEQSHYEILIRLTAEDGTIIPPSAFIPPAERYGLMPLIDRWVLQEIFKKILSGHRYAINLSGQTVSDPTFVEYVERLLQTYPIDPYQICFEITETAAIEHLDTTNALIHRLKEKGFRFSLDDFGSGLSSFAYLKNMSVDYLKIDGIFVKDIVHDPISYAMVNSINQIGHTMGLKTIAEYVEDEAILNKLHEIGIDFAQGYFIHKPEPLDGILL